MIATELLDLVPAEPITDSETDAGDDAGGIDDQAEDEPLPTDDEDAAPADSGFSKTGRALAAQQIAYLDKMGITGCGLGRRIKMLMDPDDWTDQEVTDAIRATTPEPDQPPLTVALKDEDPYTPPDPDAPTTCDATTADLPAAPPLTLPDLPDEPIESKIIAVMTELDEIAALPIIPDMPPPAKRITAALRRASAVLGKAIKPGTTKYYDLLAQAIAGIRDYLARTGATQDREGWTTLLNRTLAQLDAARNDPYAGLPPLPFFWPAPPAGLRVEPITPIYQAPPGGGIALPAGSYTGRPIEKPPGKPDVYIDIVAPPPGLSEAAQYEWKRLFEQTTTKGATA